jgi:hypothetical protein
MAFQRRPLNTIPTQTPDVDIIFHGQLLLRSDGASCEVAVNPIALSHQLSIEIRTKIPNQSDVIHMRHHGPLNFRQPGMTIAVDPVQSPRIAWKCVADTTINYQHDTVTPADDFRWILNMEGDQFHNSALTCSAFGTQHVIRLENGEYFFRTGVRAPAGLKYVRELGGQNPTPFRRIGAIARASLFLQSTQTLNVRWNDGFNEQLLALDKPVTNSTHEIYIENTPLFIPRHIQLGHDELLEYYKVFPGVAGNARFTFESVDEGGGGFDKGTPTIPCQVMRLDEPGN